MNGFDCFQNLLNITEHNSISQTITDKGEINSQYLHLTNVEQSLAKSCECLKRALATEMEVL